MPGALLQLVRTGAQNELLNGNPSMTHFRSYYRRHTNFAMEHVRMAFTSSNLELTATGTKTLSCRIDRYGQLLHDCYTVFTLPDIWSPLKQFTGPAPPGYQSASNSIGYEFQWIDNIGYNMIDHITLTMNGQVIQRLSGEWLKMYSYLTHDSNKREIVNQMVGNVPELNDPANAYDRQNQYPHAITPSTIPTTGPQTVTPEPSIRSRQLVIPLHFWFCENPGTVLPLVSLQNAEVYINVTFRSLNDLYTVIDVDKNSPTFGTRIKPNNDNAYNALTLFLSPPLVNGTQSNPILTNFFPDPYIEGNFVFLTEMEMHQLAKADQTFLVRNIRYVNKEGQFGANSDLELPFFNMVTRVVFFAQRSDRMLLNDWDNYTNWQNANRAPWDISSSPANTSLYSTGQQQVSSVYPKDAVIDALLLFDGEERITAKPSKFFSLLQTYRHTTGDTPQLPGMYTYSFALDNDVYQPSGAVNGSMFNKAILRTSLQQPLPLSSGTPATIEYVIKSTLFNQIPTTITAAQCALLKADGTKLYKDVVSVVRTNDNIIFVHTYNLGAYVESINYLRIVSGTGNLVFAS